MIGIDNEELIQYLSRISLSSVTQGTRKIGYQAAKMLDNLLNGQKVSHKPILIPPLKVEQRSSTDYRSLQDPLVMQAMHYIANAPVRVLKPSKCWIALEFHVPI